MDFQAYNRILICKDDIVNVRIGDKVVGYEFHIKYPSYRGVFLSCIEKLEFSINGERLDSGNICLLLNGKQFTIAELPECFKEYWFVRNKATVRVMKEGGIPAGDHMVNVYMRHRVPYTGYFGEYLVLDSNETDTLQAV